MNIDYKLESADKEIIRRYVRAAVTRKVLKKYAAKKHYPYSYQISERFFLWQCNFLIVSLYLIFSVVKVLLNGVTFQNIVVHLTGLMLLVLLLVLLKPVVIGRLYPTYKKRSYRLQRSLKRRLSAMDIENLIKMRLAVLGKIASIDVNITENTGAVVLMSGVKQVFDCQRVIEENVIDNMTFYKFTDNADGKAYILPVPAGCHVAFKTALAEAGAKTG